MAEWQLSRRVMGVGGVGSLGGISGIGGNTEPPIRRIGGASEKIL